MSAALHDGEPARPDTEQNAPRHGVPSPVLAFGAFVLGAAVLLLTITSFLLASHPIMGAALIVAVPFVTVLMLALLQYFDRRDR